MSDKGLPWFRLYSDVVDDPKVQRLADKLFRTWINLLCIARKNGGRLRAYADMAFTLRLSESETRARVETLHQAELFDGDTSKPETLEPHNWNGRQFASDNSTERVRKHRRNVSRNVSTNVPETPRETPPDTEQNRTESPDAIASSPQAAEVFDEPRQRKRRIDPDWCLTAEDIAYAFEEHGWPLERIEREAAEFKHWHEESGKKRIDFGRAWQSWVRKSVGFERERGQSRGNGSGAPSVVQAIAEGVARAAAASAHR